MIDPRIVREAKRLRARWEEFNAARSHYREHFVTSGGSLSHQITFSDAIEYATWIVRGEDMDLYVSWETESEPWDGDDIRNCPAPKHLLCGVVYDPDNPRRCLASLGMVGVNSLRDPYLDTECANLLREAIEEIDARNDRAATLAANELASRPTYAGIVSP